MASPQVCENLDFINGDDETREMEVMKINGALLMSLMEESPSDESDDDRLDSLIRSFEAEIRGSKMDGHDSASVRSEWVSIGEGTQYWNIEQMDSQDYWASSCEFGVEWMEMDLTPSSPCDDRNWCIDPHGDEMDGMAEFFYVGNNLKVCDGFAMGEHGYNSFWQDSCNLVICD